MSHYQKSARLSLVRTCQLGLILLSMVTEVSAEESAARFKRSIKPLLEAACIHCHEGSKAKAGFDMARYRDLRRIKHDHEQWALIRDLVVDGDMPPPKAKRQLSVNERKLLLDWIADLRAAAVAARAGDPGPRAIRRLSNAEYDNTIRDLIGHDIRPTRSFPFDQTNKAGFPNDASVLTLTPAQIDKYQQTATNIANHTAFLTEGLAFGPTPMLSANDYEKWGIRRVLAFYGRVQKRWQNLGGHLFALRRRQQAGPEMKAKLRLQEQAEQLSSRYIDLIARHMTPAWSQHPLFADLAKEFVAIDTNQIKQAQQACQDLAKTLQKYSATLPNIAADYPDRDMPRAYQARQTHAKQRFTPPKITVTDNAKLYIKRHNRNHGNSITVFSNGIEQHIRQNRAGDILIEIFAKGDGTRNQGIHCTDLRLHIKRYTEQKRKKRTIEVYSLEQWLAEGNVPEQLRNLVGKGQTFPIGLNKSFSLKIKRQHLPIKHERDHVELHYKIVRSDTGPGLVKLLHANQHTQTSLRDAGSFLVTAQHDETITQLRHALTHFRGFMPSWWIQTHSPKYTTALSAGLYHMQGLFREDTAVKTWFLNAAECEELDRLWDDLLTTTDASSKLYREFLWWERTWGKGKNKRHHPDFSLHTDTDALLPNKVAKVAALFGHKNVDQDSDTFFARILRDHARESRLRQEAEPTHLRDLLSFAERAWRRPLSAGDHAAIRENYNVLRQSGTDHQSAIRDCIRSILMAPQFFFHLEPVPKGQWGPIDNHTLANRLSYLLWASMPDKELRALANQGKLGDSMVMTEQLQRMLKDRKIRGLASEFVTNWLHSRHFHQWTGVDRQFFAKAYNDQLQASMHEEPIRFAIDLFQQGTSFFDLLYAKHSIVDAQLATHYRVPYNTKRGGWQQVTMPPDSGRGGILGMGVYLTMHAPGRRTSPVKRGHWLVTKVLGEHIPPPPETVSAIPDNEKDLGKLTLRQVLHQHREQPGCANCHRRFDGYGLLFEGMDPIGRTRSKDFGGRPIDTDAQVSDGSTVAGLSQLRDHLRNKRHDDFVRQLSRQLLIYALGRDLRVIDDPVLARLQKVLHEKDGDVKAALQVIITSRQFTHVRGSTTLGQIGTTP